VMTVSGGLSVSNSAVHSPGVIMMPTTLSPSLRSRLMLWISIKNHHTYRLQFDKRPAYKMDDISGSIAMGSLQALDNICLLTIRLQIEFLP